MDTIASMISRRLREIDAQFSAEVSSPHPQAGGAIAEASADPRDASGDGGRALAPLAPSKIRAAL